MKFSEPWGRQRLSFLLETAASREAMMWKGCVPKKPSSQDTDVSPAQRDEAVRWLTELHGRLQFYPETLVLAVNILDRFLAPIKARPKYLRCIAIACFFLGVKTCEEDECVPSLKELVESSDCGCSPSEILRMEKIILDKLNWDLHTATALDFLHIFHAMVLSSRSGSLDSGLGLNRSQHLALLTQRLYHCLSDHTLMQLRGSMLALALITLELETCCPDWLALTIDLLRTSQIDSSELIRSRELVSRRLSSPRASLPPNTLYIYQPPAPDPPRRRRSPDCPWDHAPPALSRLPPLLSPPRKILQTVTLRCKASAKRKVEEMEVDDIYDGIKRLYNEDITNATAAVQEGAPPAPGGAERAAAGGGLGVCSVLLPRQEGSSSPCPPLQPVSAS